MSLLCCCHLPPTRDGGEVFFAEDRFNRKDVNEDEVMKLVANCEDKDYTRLDCSSLVFLLDPSR